MSSNTLLQRLKLRHKLAALGVVSMALCTLPLIQLLRYQGLELQLTSAAQAQLEPAVLAVELQRGLVDHRASAALWLRGQRQVEARRRQDQAAVDAHLAMLDHRLEFNDHPGARTEVAAMRIDWISLVQQVIDKRCSVADSDLAHRLLVEQALQVIDTVTAAAGHSSDARGLRQAAAQARIQLMAATPDWQAAAQTLASAIDLTRQSQAQRLASHRTLRVGAAAALLALGLAIGGALAWLLGAWRVSRQPPVPAAVPPHAPATPDDGSSPPSDGQQPVQQARQHLLHRLRRPAHQAPRLDQPTEPQEP